MTWGQKLIKSIVFVIIFCLTPFVVSAAICWSVSSWRWRVWKRQLTQLQLIRAAAINHIADSVLATGPEERSERGDACAVFSHSWMPATTTAWCRTVSYKRARYGGGAHSYTANEQCETAIDLTAIDLSYAVRPDVPDHRRRRQPRHGQIYVIEASAAIVSSINRRRTNGKRGTSIDRRPTDRLRPPTMPTVERSANNLICSTTGQHAETENNPDWHRQTRGVLPVPSLVLRHWGPQRKLRYSITAYINLWKGRGVNWLHFAIQV